MAEWLGNGLQNHVQQFDSAWHLDLLVISFSVINYVVSMSCPRGMRRRSFFLHIPLWKPQRSNALHQSMPEAVNMAS